MLDFQDGRRAPHSAFSWLGNTPPTRTWNGTISVWSDESELAPLEEHLLACPSCVERAKKTQDYVDAIRAGIIESDFDLD
jgi:hypothetical protein